MSSEIKNKIHADTADPHAEARKLIHETNDYFASLWTEDMEVIDCNDQCLDFFGISKEVFLNSFFDLCPTLQPDGQPSLSTAHAYIKKALETGFCAFNWSYIKHDGTVLLAKESLVRHEFNGKKYVISYKYDMTQETPELEKLQGDYERTQTLLKHLPIGIDFWSKDGVLLDCNESSVRMFGLSSREEYLAKFHSFNPEYQPNGRTSLESITQRLQEAMDNGHARFEWMHTTPDGKEMPAEIILAKVKSGGEDIIFAYYIDLTAIKESAKNAEKAEQRLIHILDAAPYSITIWNDKFKPLDCNLATINFFGFDDKDDFLNNYYAAIPTFRQTGVYPGGPFLELFNQVIEDGYAYYEGELGHAKTDEVFFVEVTLRKLIIDEQVFVVTYLNDLTYQRAMLNEIVESHRTISIARDAAEKSTQVKGEFLANMSHEIRTPMNGILGLIHLLGFTNLQDQQKDYVDKIRHSAESLLRIINDILDFSKIESGKLEIENTSFTLAEIQEDLYTLFAPKIAEKNLQGHIFNVEGIDTKLIGDPLRLKQVLFNLIGNAIKFTENGSIIANVQMDINNADQKVDCHFYVKDTGIGLDTSQAKRLFKAFGQADTSTTRKYGGTGLGLVISKRIVEIMQGKIWVESELGKGSTFHFTAKFDLDTSITEDLGALNIIDTDATAFANIADANAHATKPKLLGHILLVEDNEINQLIATELLSAKGYIVDVANHGQKALDMLNEKTYDAVLMDIQMPVMDGLTAATKIREYNKFAELPVIAMSAHAMKGDKEISIKHGMNDHLSKPINPEELYSTLQHWLDKK